MTEQEIRKAAAELVVLEAYHEARRDAGHDYGGGQRYGELTRRRHELSLRAGSPLSAWVDLDGRDRPAVLNVRTADYLDVCVVEPTDAELDEAARRLLRPRLLRIVRDETFRRHTPASRRTVDTLDLLLDRYGAAAELGAVVA